MKKAQEEWDNAKRRITEGSQGTVDETNDKRVNETNAQEKKNVRTKRGKRKSNSCYRQDNLTFIRTI